MLCKYCSNIDLAQCRTDEGYQHHRNYFDLCKSGGECMFCDLIATKFGAWAQEMCLWANYVPDSNFDLQEAENSRITLQSSSWSRSRQRESFHFVILKDYGGFEVILATTEDDPATEWLPGRVLSARADSLACFTQAHGWLKECLTRHPSCQSSPTTILPTRVIDVGPKGQLLPPRLHLSSQGEIGEWITLSHCWGQSQPLTTTRKTLPKRTAEIPLSLFPPLFRDAISITRELGYQYLWIDSLCIIQDLPQDWSSESAAMEKTYGDAVLCIAAEDCADSGTGIFESGNKLRAVYQNHIQVPCYNSKEPGVVGTMYTGPDWLQYRSEFGPLSRRAWTLQEEILAPRTLKWTSKQLQWGCRTMERVEQFPDKDFLDTEIMAYKRVCDLTKVSLSTTADPISLHTVYSLWTQIVSRLSMRSITYETDRFPSLSGIARVVQIQTGWSYKAGLWLEKMHEDLLWTVGASSDKFKQSEVYVAPSWSWASVFRLESSHWSFPRGEEGHRRDYQKPRIHPGVEFPKLSPGWTTTTVIEKIEINNTGGDFGKVLSATLKISGLARQSGQTVYLQILNSPYFPHLKNDETMEDGDNTPPVGETYRGIILTAVKGQNHSYRRVETFYFWDRQAYDHIVSVEPQLQFPDTQIEHLNSNWTRQTFTIV